MFKLKLKYEIIPILLQKPASLFADDDPFAPKSSPSKKSFLSPALPPKDKKKPPPRPAPPKGKSPSPSKVSTGNDPFAGSDPFSGSGASKPSGTGSDPFSNFADFSPGKVSVLIQYIKNRLFMLSL